MTKTEFLQALEAGLAGASPEERVAAMQYYTEYLDDAGPEHEAAALAELGSPEKVVAEILGTEKENPWKTPKAEAKKAAAPVFSNNAQPPIIQAEAPQQTAGDAINSMPPPPGAPNPPGGSGMYPPAGTYPPPPTGENAGQTPPPHTPPTRGEYDKRNNGIAKIVLIVLACIFILPIGTGLFSAFFGVLAAVAVCLFIPIIIGVAFVASGVAVAIIGIMLAVAAAGPGLLVTGVGLLLLGLGLMCCYGGGQILRVIPRMFAALARSFSTFIKRIFRGSAAAQG